MENAEAMLKRFFGYDNFKKGQKPIVERITNGKDVVAIMPTGFGKSICYQVPALILDGMAIIISPLISLMKDQVDSLEAAGVAATYINSALNGSEIKRRLAKAFAGEYKLLYIAPERLELDSITELAATMPISLLAVDEAHCVSQWGHDFRPSYLRIADFVSAMPSRPPMAAFTATATPRVQQDIIEILKLNSPHVTITGFDRENLFFAVEHPRDRLAYIIAYLRSHPEQSGIIYAITRKEVDRICEKICANGFYATRYHAGLSEMERARNQEDFIYDRAPIIVATNAFGMGVDKSNVSFVIHHNMPKSIEAYYQEAGRAGRDGSPADCVLLYNGSDIFMNRYLIDHGSENGGREEKDRDYRMLNKMIEYTKTMSCLRGFILDYFSEESMSDCGNCSNCISSGEKTDITVITQKILSCVKRMGESYGAKIVSQVLRGKQNDKIISRGFSNLSTFGIMADCNERLLDHYINAIIGLGYLETSGGKYPVLRLTSEALSVLKGEQQVFIKLKPEAFVAKKAKRAAFEIPPMPGMEYRSVEWDAALSPDVELRHDMDSQMDRAMLIDSAGERVFPGVSPKNTARRKATTIFRRNGSAELFERLRALRRSIAERDNVPPYVVFADATLMEMSERRPQNEIMFLDISGVGNKKLARYGEAFLNEIRKYVSEYKG